LKDLLFAMLGLRDKVRLDGVRLNGVETRDYGRCDCWEGDAADVSLEDSHWFTPGQLTPVV